MNEEKIEKIDKKIAHVKKLLKNVKGTKTEVWTRIVGYYRSVKFWNKGQAAQRKERKNFKIT